MSCLRNAFFIVLGLLALVAGVLGCLILWNALQVARAVRVQTPGLIASYQNLGIGTQKGLGSLVHFMSEDAKVIGGLATNLEKSTRELHTAVDAQVKAMTKTSDVLAGLVEHTDHLLNDARDGLLPAATATTKQAGVLLAKLAEDEGQFALTLAEAAVAMKNLAELTGDPAVKQAVADWARTSAYVAHISEQTAAMADDMRGYIHRATKPMSKAMIAYELVSRAFPLIAAGIP